LNDPHADLKSILSSDAFDTLVGWNEDLFFEAKGSLTCSSGMEDTSEILAANDERARTV
jgi:hypothetical protein